MKTAKVVNRLHRIQGQLNAIEKMLESDKNPKEVLMQVEAIISGMKSLKAECVKQLIRNAPLKDIDDFIDLIN